MNKEIHITYKVKYYYPQECSDLGSYSNENISTTLNLSDYGNMSFSSFVDNFKKATLWDTGNKVESIKVNFYLVNNDFKRNHFLIKSAVRWKGRKYYGGNALTRYWKWLLNK